MQIFFATKVLKMLHRKQMFDTMLWGICVGYSDF